MENNNEELSENENEIEEKTNFEENMDLKEDIINNNPTIESPKFDENKEENIDKKEDLFNITSLKKVNSDLKIKEEIGEKYVEKTTIDNSDVDENFFISMEEYNIFLNSIDIVKKNIDESYNIHKWFMDKNKEDNDKFDKFKTNILEIENTLYKLDEIIFENKKNGK